MSTTTTNQLPDTSTLTVKCVAIDAALHDHVSRSYWDWRGLYERAAVRAPLQHPDYVLGEVRHAAPQRCQPVLITAERNGEVVGAAPLVPKVFNTRRVGSLGPGRRVYGLRLSGNEFLLSQPDATVTAALWEATFAQVRESRASYLLIEDLDEQSLMSQVGTTTIPTDWLQFRHAGVQPRRRIQLPATAAEYWGGFSKKTLQTFRRKLKKFGETRLERITSEADVPRFLEAAHRISLETWQTRQLGLRVRNNAEELELLTTLARHGLLRSYLWSTNGEPVAFTIGNQDRGCFHYEEVGYKTPYARFSPGQMMLVAMLDDLFQHDRPDWFDFGGGDADYKQQFANHESRSGTVWLWPPSLGNVLTVQSLRASRRVRHLVRRSIVSLGYANQARQWVRYGWQRLTQRKAAVTSAPSEEE